MYNDYWHTALFLDTGYTTKMVVAWWHWLETKYFKQQHSFFLNLRDMSHTPRKTLLNLCVSLILLYGVFLGGIELIQPRVACIIFAALIHYFFLSSVCWSSAEAIVCFYLLVLTRRSMTNGYLLRMMLFCWGKIKWETLIHSIIAQIHITTRLKID